MEIVRICEIFTHEGLGIMSAGSAMVNGNPAFCAWLVIAITITVSDFLLNRSWLRIRTGRNPACSRPRTGSGPPSRLRLSIFGPSVVSQTLFGQLHFFFWVDFRQLAGEPGPLLALTQ